MNTQTKVTLIKTFSYINLKYLNVISSNVIKNIYCIKKDYIINRLLSITLLIIKLLSIDKLRHWRHKLKVTLINNNILIK